MSQTFVLDIVARESLAVGDKLEETQTLAGLLGAQTI
jgi:hypothetical protein